MKLAVARTLLIQLHQDDVLEVLLVGGWIKIYFLDNYHRKIQRRRRKDIEVFKIFDFET